MFSQVLNIAEHPASQALHSRPNIQGSAQQPDVLGAAQAADQKRADEAARRREKQQAARESRAAAAAEALRQRQRKEKAASNLRGPPPPLRRDFRLPPDVLPDLLVVWEFTQVPKDLALSKVAAAICAAIITSSVCHDFLVSLAASDLRSAVLGCRHMEASWAWRHFRCGAWRRPSRRVPLACRHPSQAELQQMRWTPSSGRAGSVMLMRCRLMNSCAVSAV